MEGVFPIIRDIVVNGVLARATERDYRPVMVGSGIMALAGIIFVLALIFASLALFGFLQTVYSDPVAYSILAAVLLVLCGITMIAGRRAMTARATAISAQSQQEVKELIDQLLSEDLWDDIRRPVQDHPKTALATAAVAGFVAGDRMRG